jgi:hypothetical protein
MQLVYVGPFDEIHLPALHINIERGTVVDLDEGAATAMLAQVDNFALPDDPRSTDAINARAARLAAAANEGTSDGDGVVVNINTEQPAQGNDTEDEA